MEIVPFETRFEQAVIELIVGIERGEFGIPISAEQRPDLRQIPSCCQTDSGNFWVALAEGHVVGTIASLEIGNAQAGVALLLLETLLDRATGSGIRDVFLGTTSKFIAAHRFYEKHGFAEIRRHDLPAHFRSWTST
jgi:hypothetical protein